MEGESEVGEREKPMLLWIIGNQLLWGPTEEVWGRHFHTHPRVDEEALAYSPHGLNEHGRIRAASPYEDPLHFSFIPVVLIRNPNNKKQPREGKGLFGLQLQVMVHHLRNVKATGHFTSLLAS